MATYTFYCPACQVAHTTTLDTLQQMSGTTNAPTLSARVITYKVGPGEPNAVQRRCDVGLKNGALDYAWDCQHNMKGQTTAYTQPPLLVLTLNLGLHL